MTIRVYFVGVCTHIKKDARLTPWLEVPHRVVLIQAREERKVDEHHRIPRHFSRLIIDGDKPIQIEEGVTIGIVSRGEPVRQENPEIVYSDSYGDLPRLRQFVPDLEVSEHVVQGRDVRLADAYFDIDRGKLGACCARRTVAAELQIEDPAANLRLTYWSRPDVIEYELRPDSTICVLHLAREHRSDDDHFLLHYGIAGPLQLRPVPSEVDSHGDVPALCLPDDSVGPGCSDSSYP